MWSICCYLTGLRLFLRRLKGSTDSFQLSEIITEISYIDKKKHCLLCLDFYLLYMKVTGILLYQGFPNFGRGNPRGTRTTLQNYQCFVIQSFERMKPK